MPVNIILFVILNNFVPGVQNVLTTNRYALIILAKYQHDTYTLLKFTMNLSLYSYTYVLTILIPEQ